LHCSIFAPHESELAEAVALFMDKDEKGAIGTFVSKSLDDTRQLLNKEVRVQALLQIARRMCLMYTHAAVSARAEAGGQSDGGRR
jgi:hypothetical protein